MSPAARWNHPPLTWLVAGVAWFGLGLQLLLSLRLVHTQGGSLLNGVLIYLGYFTVLTNLLVALSLSWAALRPHTRAGRWFQRSDVATAVAVSIAMVGLAYHLLLWRGIWLQTYPYPFIDVTTLGYPRTLLNAFGLLVVFLLMGTAFVAVARWRLRHTPR